MIIDVVAKSAMCQCMLSMYIGNELSHYSCSVCARSFFFSFNRKLSPGTLRYATKTAATGKLLALSGADESTLRLAGSAGSHLN